MIHPLDARARGITHGDVVRVRSRTGSVAVRAELSPDIMPGVVSLPHGWRGARRVCGQAPGADGVSVNDVTDDHRLDGLAGTAAFNGVAVDVTVAVRDEPEGATETMERTAI
jgi:anaerobic selenocysteine-containing dehydrogenase